MSEKIRLADCLDGCGRAAYARARAWMLGLLTKSVGGCNGVLSGCRTCLI